MATHGAILRALPAVDRGIARGYLPRDNCIGIEGVREGTMAGPRSLLPSYERLPQAAQISVKRDYERRKKSMLFAYLAWLTLGWHYLYPRRVGLQFAFWVTLGGLLVWWLVDLFRVAGMVNRLNEDTARELMVQYKALNQ